MGSIATQLCSGPVQNHLYRNSTIRKMPCTGETAAAIPAVSGDDYRLAVSNVADVPGEYSTRVLHHLEHL